MGEAEERRGLELLRRRLHEMGIPTRRLPGGRSLLGTLRPRNPSFPGARGPRRIEELGFASMGPKRIKLLTPAPFFLLPPLPIADCTHAAALEERIRSAWCRRLETLGALASSLKASGLACELEHDGAQLAIPLAVAAAARLRLDSLRRIVLPSPGPLAGVALARAGDRLFCAPASLEDAIDLELAATARLEALARRAARREARARLQTPSDAAHGGSPPPPCVLLVGPVLGGSATLQQALHLRNFHVTQVRGTREALRVFTRSSFDLVLTDAQLGRDEGVELVRALRALPGVAAIPVLVVDERPRPARREAARAAGAAGYLTHPLDLEGIAPRLRRMAEGSRGRRFVRYPLRLAVRFTSGREAGVTLGVSRRGLFVRTERPSREGDLEAIELALPGRPRPLAATARTLYRAITSSSRDPGLGLQLVRFERPEDEALWIGLLYEAESGTLA